MHPLILTALLAMANILGVGMIVPQVARLGGRNGSAGGVSGAWIGVGIALNGWWLAYGITQQLWGLVPVSLLAAILYLTMAALLTRRCGFGSLTSVTAGFVAVGLLPAPFLLTDGWTAAGVAVGVSYGLQFTPAAAVAVRSEDVSGVSLTTWSMALIEAGIWFGYGLSSGDAPLVIGGAGAAVTSMIILARLASGNRWGGLRPAGLNPEPGIAP